MQRDDLTCEVVEWSKPAAIQTRAGSLTEKILQRLLVSNKPMTMRDLCADQLVGGSVAAVKKTLKYRPMLAASGHSFSRSHSRFHGYFDGVGRYPLTYA